MPTPYDARYDIHLPSLDELESISNRYGLNLDREDLAVFGEQIEVSLQAYRRLRELPEPRPAIQYPRRPGWRPETDNELNAWAWRCDVQGRSEGPLVGRTVALKDNVCLAGVPMSNGSALLEGFVPDVDATIVTRILDAGGQIVGKAVCENFGVSSGSITAATGAVLHPRDPTLSVGGSSSGSAALLACGACDLAIGGDQGGSIRIPAALCGVAGLKPTYGLVPYTGVFPIEHSIDHVGPMGRTSTDLALLLGAIAGPDGFDPRQRGVEPDPYLETIDDGIAGVRVGLLKEGFGWPGNSDPRSDELVRDFVRRLAEAGASVTEVSIPAHCEAGSVAAPIYAEGIYHQLVVGQGFGRGWNGYYPTAVMTAHSRAIKCAPQDLSATAKLFVLLGTYMTERYDGRYYGLAQNVAMWLRSAYDDALQGVDLLAMPTCAPQAVAQPHVEDPGISDVFAAAFPYHLNAAPFNITGHPAVTLPAGELGGLSVGVMLVGRAFKEALLLRTARSCEKLA